MNAFKSIFAVITMLCNVVLKLLSSAERGANSLDELAKAGEKKAKNFRKLVELNDEAEFAKRKAEINLARKTAGLKPVDAKSSQETEKQEEADIAKKQAEAQKEAEDDLLG